MAKELLERELKDWEKVTRKHDISGFTVTTELLKNKKTGIEINIEALTEYSNFRIYAYLFVKGTKELDLAHRLLWEYYKIRYGASWEKLIPRFFLDYLYKKKRKTT